MNNLVKINGRYVSVRQGLMERVWKLTGSVTMNGFKMETSLYIRGTEIEMREYINSELPNFNYVYSAVSFDDENKVNAYLAPQINGHKIGNI